MLVIFLIAPWLAFVVSLAFLFLSRLARFPLIGGTSAAWALYGAYEYLMYFRVLCSVNVIFARICCSFIRL